MSHLWQDVFDLLIIGGILSASETFVMKKLNHSKFVRSMMLASFVGVSITAHAADDLQGWTINGHLDTYYLYDFGKPGTLAGTNVRQFDIKNNQFGFAALEVDLTRKATDKNPFGITANILFGKNADIIAFNEPGGQESSKVLQQLYVTYALSKYNTTVDFGKFLSWVGYEGVDSSTNDNYSRSFLYTLGQPIYHTGLRGNFACTKNVSANLYFVNGWNEVEDSNGGKSYGATLAYTPSEATAVTANYYGGQEGSAGVSGIGFTSLGGRTVNLGDLIVTHQLTKNIKLALNADYADAKGFDGTAGGHWSGIAAYAKINLSDKFAAAVRAETFSDTDGLRGNGNSARYNSLTGNLDYALTKDSLFRLELRYDKSNIAVFNSDNGGTSDNRTTLSFSHVLKF